MSYKHHLHLIQEQIKRNLTYSFANLSNRMLHEPWAIDRTTLEHARNSGELICNNTTTVKGEWLLSWAFKTPAQRRAFAQSKIAKQLRANAT